MLKLSIEELAALDLVSQFATVKEILAAAGQGFAELAASETDREKSDLCYKVSKTLRD